MTNREAESKVGHELTNMILDMCHDGELTIEEVETLHQFLRKSGDPFAAIPYLRAITREIVADGSVCPAEAYRLKKGMERVVQKEVRKVVSTHLESVGTPVWGDDDYEPAWTKHEATTKQIEFILNLGGKIAPGLTKGAASKQIDFLLERRPPTPRQMMLLRFFDRLDLVESTKERVSVWIDDLFIRHEEMERAWHRYKLTTKHDPYERDWSIIPIGAYRQFVKTKKTSRQDVSRN